jgi:signal transduction histidine kinase
MLLEPLRLLIVDDDAVDRMAVRRLLAQAGIDGQVDERSDPGSALEAVRGGSYDCVLLDYYLPGTDGVTLLGALREAGNRTPIVSLTGQGDQELAVELMKAGAADYLNKNTLTADRLERSLRFALALRRAEDERQLLLEREQQARLQAQAANRAKDEFLATLSHELRTPLNAILGWATLLSGGRLDPDTTRRAAAIIERNTRLQAQLIDDLLDISRIITGKLRLEFGTVGVAGLIESALDSVRPAAQAKQITLMHAFDDPGQIEGDAARLQQVVWNLLHNAIKFTPEGGRVSVAAAARDGTVAVTVTDTGQGIDPAFLPHVFERFRQQDSATTRAHGGLGLGLSIVRHLVELHGGHVTAASGGPGAGATFTVTLPASSRPAVAPPGTAAAAPGLAPDAASLEGIHVLVLHHDGDFRADAAGILGDIGARVTMATTVDEAIDAVAHERPDAIVSEIALPGEDGYSLIRRVRALDDGEPPIPAAAVTMTPTAGDRSRALLSGYQAHLSVPLDAAELSAVVAALVGRVRPQTPTAAES